MALKAFIAFALAKRSAMNAVSSCSIFLRGGPRLFEPHGETRFYLSTFPVDKYVVSCGKAQLSRTGTRLFVALIIFCTKEKLLLHHIDM